MIAQKLQIDATKRYIDPLATEINHLQEISKTHAAISKAKTQTWHRILTQYLPLYFPEIESFAGDHRSAVEEFARWNRAGAGCSKGSHADAPPRRSFI